MVWFSIPRLIKINKSKSLRFNIFVMSTFLVWLEFLITVVEHTEEQRHHQNPRFYICVHYWPAFPNSSGCHAPTGSWYLLSAMFLFTVPRLWSNFILPTTAGPGSWRHPGSVAQKLRNFWSRVLAEDCNVKIKLWALRLEKAMNISRAQHSRSYFCISLRQHVSIRGEEIEEKSQNP